MREGPESNVRHQTAGCEVILGRLSTQNRLGYPRYRPMSLRYRLQGYIIYKKCTPLGPYCTVDLCSRSYGGPRGLGVFLWARHPL